MTERASLVVEPVVSVVGDLSDAYRGWEIRVEEPPPLLRRSFVLGKGFGSGVRRWEYDGVEMVGLTDDVRSAGIVGTERIYRSDTPCELVRQVKKSRRRMVWRRRRYVVTANEAGIYLEISEATAVAGKPLQVNISKLDEHGGGHGHRIAGPKFGGSGSRLLRRVRIDAASARAIQSYLDQVTS